MKNRIAYISGLRVFSMLMVVLIHTCIMAVSAFGTTGSNIEINSLYAIRNLLHFAVPTFLMISGALLLDPQKEISASKLGSYIVKYGADIIIFGWGFAFLESVFTTRKIGLTEISDSFINMLSGNTWNHMWYLYALFGIMLLLPLMKNFVIGCKISGGGYEYVLLISCLSLTVVPLIEKYVGFKFGFIFPISTVYPLYVLMGDYLKRNEIGIKQKYIIYLIAALTAAVVILTLVNPTLGEVIGGYSSPLIAVLAGSIFLLFKSMNGQKATKLFSSSIMMFLDKCSFGVYLVHMIFINVIYKVLKVNPFHGMLGLPINIILIWLICLILSVVLAAVLKKLPVIRKLI